MLQNKIQNKTCAHCHQVKSASAFSPNKRMKCGLASWCKACSSRCFASYVRENPIGFLNQLYRKMKIRVDGSDPSQKKMYRGLPICTKDEFLEWARETNFLELFAAWHKSGMQRRLVPSINRINNRKGYEIGNMEFLSLSDNSAAGGRNGRGCRRPRRRSSFRKAA